MCDFSRRLSCRIVNIVINNPSTTFWTGRIYCSYSSSKGKVRQRPSHQHHRRNEHNKHSFPELHTSKILSAQNLCAHLSGLRLTDVFSSGFRKSAAECTAVPVGFYPCTCLRFSNCRDSSVSTRLSDSHAPCIGSFLKYAGIISSILHPLTPVSAVWFASGYSIPYPTYPVNQILQNSYISPHFTNCSHSICTKRL